MTITELPIVFIDKWEHPTANKVLHFNPPLEVRQVQNDDFVTSWNSTCRYPDFIGILGWSSRSLSHSVDEMFDDLMILWRDSLSCDKESDLVQTLTKTLRITDKNGNQLYPV